MGTGRDSRGQGGELLGDEEFIRRVIDFIDGLAEGQQRGGAPRRVQAPARGL